MQTNPKAYDSEAVQAPNASVSSGAVQDGSKDAVAQRQRLDALRVNALSNSLQRQAAQLTPASLQPVTQAKMVDTNGHGQVWVADDIALAPDVPKYGGTADVGTGGLKHKAATSMEVLVTPGHPQGSSPKELEDLFQALPTKGNYDLDANQGKTKDGSTLYIKGHLLNDNLGGPGTAENLFPITHQANGDHDRKVEEPIKDHVNKEGGAVHYKVVVDKHGQGVADVYADESKAKKLQYVNSTYRCTVREFGADHSVKSHSADITSTWGGTDNSSVEPVGLLDQGVHGVASQFDASKVKIMPRAKAKAEWDTAFLQLATHLAQTDNVKLAQWLQKHVSGVGAASAKILVDNLAYESLKPNQKGTLTKARKLLQDFLEKSYSDYLGVYVDEATADLAPQEEQAKEALKTQIDNLAIAQESLEEELDYYASNAVLLQETGFYAVPKPVKKYGLNDKIPVSKLQFKLKIYSTKMDLIIDITRSDNSQQAIVTEEVTSQAFAILQRHLGHTPTVNDVKANVSAIAEVFAWGFSE